MGAALPIGPSVRLYAPEQTGPSLSPQMRFSEFYRLYFKPICLIQQHAAKGTLSEYDQTAGYIVAATADAPLASFDRGPPELFDQSKEGRDRRWRVDQLVTQIMAYWWALPGKRKGETASPWTVIKHRTHAQAMLDRAGPGTRKKPGVGLIQSAPYLPTPKKPDDDPKGILELSEVTAILGSCQVAAVPADLPVTAAVWWVSLIWFCFNTGLRIGTLRGLRWPDLETPTDDGCWINIRRADYKGAGSRRFWINSSGLQALETLHPLRAAGYEKIFHWPHGTRWLYRTLEVIQQAAGLPESRRWGVKFHGVRKCTATEIVQINAMAAQIVLGHTTAEMARKHYVRRDVSKEALQRLPQPGNIPIRPTG